MTEKQYPGAADFSSQHLGSSWVLIVSSCLLTQHLQMKCVTVFADTRAEMDFVTVCLRGILLTFRSAIVVLDVPWFHNRFVYHTVRTESPPMERK